jgi:hypothetical protein
MVHLVLEYLKRYLLAHPKALAFLSSPGIAGNDQNGAQLGLQFQNCLSTGDKIGTSSQRKQGVGPERATSPAFFADVISTSYCILFFPMRSRS